MKLIKQENLPIHESKIQSTLVKHLSIDYIQKLILPSEQQLYLAHFGKLIKFYEVKEDVQQITEFITLWRICLGIKEQPSEEELLINLTFIKNNYGDFTLEMLKLAVNLSLTYKLGKSIELYGNAFAPLYIGQVLSAFETYANKNMRDILKKQKEYEMSQANKQAERTYQQRVKDRREGMIAYAKQIVSTDQFVIDFKSYTWRFVKGNRLIDYSKIDILQAKTLAHKAMEADVQHGLIEKIIEGFATNRVEDEKAALLNKYGRYFVMKQFFSKINNIEDWVNSFPDDKIWPDDKKNDSDPVKE